MVPWPRCALAAAVATLGLALAGCFPNSSAARPTPAATQTPTSSASLGAPTATPTGQAGTAECSSDEIGLTEGQYPDPRPVQDGVGHIYGYITLANISLTTCWVRGYSGFTAEDDAERGIEIGGRGQIPLITLKPGQVATVELAGNSASCSPAKSDKYFAFLGGQQDQAQLPGLQQWCA